MGENPLERKPHGRRVIKNSRLTLPGTICWGDVLGYFPGFFDEVFGFQVVGIVGLLWCSFRGVLGGCESALLDDAVGLIFLGIPYDIDVCVIICNFRLVL